MIEYVVGDIFNSDTQAIVNPVNTVGVMGRGLALDFKKKFPSMYSNYRKLCDKNLFRIGSLMYHYSNEKLVICFPTKKHYRQPSKIEYIETGLKKFVSTYNRMNIQSISFPALGCGLGGLDWETEVKPLMEKHLGDLPIMIKIYVEKG